MSSHMSKKNDIAYPFLSFESGSVEVGGLKSNFDRTSQLMQLFISSGINISLCSSKWS